MGGTTYVCGVVKTESKQSQLRQGSIRTQGRNACDYLTAIGQKETVMSGFPEGRRRGPATHSVRAALTTQRLSYFCGLTLMSVLAGCLPGGMFMPVPIPHNDRPAIRGVLLEHGRPMQREHIHVASFSDQLSVSCEAVDGGTETNYMGEFELEGDRDLFTLWWDPSFEVLAICLPSDGAHAFWSTSLERDVLPPFLPEQIDAVCHLDSEF